MPTGWIEQPTSSWLKAVCCSQEVLVTRSTTELSGLTTIIVKISCLHSQLQM